MSELNAAHDYFMPVIRQNLAAAISKNAAGSHRAQIDIALQAVARLKETGQPDTPFDTSQPVQLYGPGDILGFDSRIVIRTDPKPDVGDFEPNYFPAIEFADLDFVWQFTADVAQATGVEDDSTPDGQQAVKLAPWIALIVLVSETRGEDIQAEFTEGTWSERNLPRHIVVDTSVLPDLAHAWRWAHVHITGEANLSKENLGERLRTNPEGAICRLLCPRRLRPGTRYTAFVVPTFKLGVLAGRGQALDPNIDALQPAWNPGDGEIELPYYYRWEFGTSMRGDFEHLVRLLEPRQLIELGTRDIDCVEPGFLKPKVTRPEIDPPEQHYLGLEGALQSLDTRYTFWGMDAFVEIQETNLIRNVEVRALPSRTSLHISWRTTEDASSYIEYGESEAYGSSVTPSTGPGQNHEAIIERLITDQAHYFKIVAQTSGGALEETAGIFQLPGRSEFQEALAELINRPDIEDKASRQLNLDVAKTDVIDNIAGTILLSGSAVQITWHNDLKPCTSLIEYGESSAYGEITEPTEEFVTEHKLTLAKLTPGKMYHFKIVARTEDGMIHETQDGTFQMTPLPWVVPPIYGRWHYGRFNKMVDEETMAVVDAGNQATWIDVLNLDPRHRTAAGLGAEVVRKQQEGLMASAWEQLGAIESANDILRRAQFGRDTSLSMFRRLEQFPAEAFLLVTQAAQKRILVENPEEAGKMITAAHFLHTQTRLIEATHDPTFRRIMRARGPIRRRQNAGRSDNILSRLVTGELEAIEPTSKPMGTTNLCDITRRLPDAVEQAPSAPTLILAPNPPVVNEGNYATLEWVVTGASSCEASGDWEGPKPYSEGVTHTERVGPITEASTYTLSCAGPGGGAIRSVTIQVEPQPPTIEHLTASSTAMDVGGCAYLEWQSRNANSCVASDDWEGNKAANGRESVGLLESGRFTLAPIGSDRRQGEPKTVSIEVHNPAPKVAMLALVPGDRLTQILTWRTVHAGECRFVAPPELTELGEVGVEGELNIGRVTSEIKTYALVCRGTGGMAAQSLTMQGSLITLATASLRVAPNKLPFTVTGGCVAIEWHTTGMRQRIASDAWSDTLPESGQRTVEVRKTSLFTLTCIDNQGRSTQLQVEVQVQDSPPEHGILSQTLPSDTDSSLWFCDGQIECQQLAEALDNYNPFADIDLPHVPDPQTMGDIVCSTLEGWLDKEDDIHEPPAHLPGFIQRIKDLILPELDPNKTILDRTKQRLRLRGYLARRFADGYQGDPLDPLRWAPNFPQPMYEPLRDISHELLLPGVERIRQNTIGLLKTNRRFLESYMCGLNHEFAGELLWRGYPTDQRGSYFRQFWDVGEYVPRADLLDNLFAAWLEPFGGSIENVPLTEKAIVLWRHLNKVVNRLLEKWLVEAGATKLDDLPDDQQQLIRRLQNEQTEAISEIPEEDINELVEELTKQELLEEMLKDITPLVIWRHNPLGGNQNRPAEDLVLLIRGDLLQRYPNALIYAVDAVQGPKGEPVPALSEYLDQGAEPRSRIYPTFRATLPPDMTFFGFPFDEDAARGNGDDLGKYFILEQRVTEPRFGLDVPTRAEPQTDDNGGLGSWDDLSWSHFELGQDHDIGKYLDAAPASAPVFSFSHQGKSWQESTSSATRAWITLQKPVRIALHARQLIPNETEQQE